MRSSALDFQPCDVVIGNTDIASSVRNALSSLDRLLGVEAPADSAELEVDICPSDEEEQLAPGFMEDDLGVLMKF